MRTKTVGMVGLGIMGSAMAANLLKAGTRVVGYDVDGARRRALGRLGGKAVGAAAEVEAPVVITSLPSSPALMEVAGELRAAGKKGGTVVLETSTLPIEDKKAARDVLARKGIVMLDCPLSGTGAQARTKDLVVYASGDAAAFRKAAPLLPGFSRAHYFLGEFGNGSRMKFVANLLVAIHNVSAAEAFALGMKAGLRAEDILRVAGDGAGSSRMFQVRGPQMVAGRYDDATMKVEVWQKDMRIIAEFAARLGVATPLFNASGAIYNAAMAQGYAKSDTASVCAVLEGLSGVRRKRRG